MPRRPGNQGPRGAPAERPFPPPWLPWAVFLAALLFTSAVRVRLLDVPLERDEGEYGYAGQLILQGIPPYKLAYNMKPPGTYAAYAVLMAVFGQTTRGIHLGLLLVSAASSLLVMRLGRRLALHWSRGGGIQYGQPATDEHQLILHRLRQRPIG